MDSETDDGFNSAIHELENELYGAAVAGDKIDPPRKPLSGY